MTASRLLLKDFTIVLAIATAFAGTMRWAIADNDTIGILITSDRQPSNFADPKNTKFELNGAHTFTSQFRYYVLRVGADLDLNRNVTWNVITFRYRDAFNPGDNFNTPQVATGFSFKLDAQRTVTTKIMRNWRDGSPSSTGVALGFKQGL